MREEIDRAYDIGYEKGARAVIDTVRKLAVEMWLDGSALEAAVQEVHEMKRERKKLCGEEEE